MHIRHFSDHLKTKVPGGHPGLYAVPIQQDRSQVLIENLKADTQEANSMPLLLDAPVNVVAMYFEPHSTLEEHSSNHPILFLVITGQGTVRIGGPQGETSRVCAGEAVLWPADNDHMVWTNEDPLQAIAIHTPKERASPG